MLHLALLVVLVASSFHFCIKFDDDDQFFKSVFSFLVGIISSILLLINPIIYCEKGSKDYEKVEYSTKKVNGEIVYSVKGKKISKKIDIIEGTDHEKGLFKPVCNVKIDYACLFINYKLYK